MTSWKKEMTYLTILYRMLECKEQIPVLFDGTDYDFISEDIEELHAREYIDINIEDAYYFITDKGKDLCRTFLQMYDQIKKFEIFSTVSVAMPIPEDQLDNEGNLLDQFYDPRFQSPESEEEALDLGTEDMRLAMINFLCSQMATDIEPLDLDPHRVVFTQLLSTGRFKKRDVWFELKLGTLFNLVGDIVHSAYGWEGAGENEEEAVEAMRAIYTAGMIEQRKRDGYECSDCGTPLAMFEFFEREEGRELKCCPNPDCGASFEPPPPEYNCPSCGAGIHAGQTTCTGCGALVDWALPPGTVTSSTTTEEVVEEEEYEPAWTDTYGYTPYGYYDPWDPFVNAAAFGVVCAVLW